MVRHILLLQPKPETTPARIESCRTALLALVGEIPGLLDCHWGANFADPSRTEGLTHGFSMDFVDQAALAAYAPHPAHQPVAAQVRSAFGRIVVLDIEL
jgi:hypothetical protein